MAKSLAPEGARSVTFAERWRQVLAVRDGMHRIIAECEERLGADYRGDGRLRGWLSHFWLTLMGASIALTRKTELSDLEALIDAGRTAPHFREFSDTPWNPVVYTTDLPGGLVFADADELYVTRLPDGSIRVSSPTEVAQSMEGGMKEVTQWIRGAEIHGWEDADDLSGVEDTPGSAPGKSKQNHGCGADHPEPLEGTPDWFLYQLLNPSGEHDWASLERWARRMVFHRGERRHDPQEVRGHIAWSIRGFLREHWERFRVRLPAGLETIPFNELVDAAENWLVEARAKHPAVTFAEIGAPLPTGIDRGASEQNIVSAKSGLNPQDVSPHPGTALTDGSGIPARPTTSPQTDEPDCITWLLDVVKKGVLAANERTVVERLVAGGGAVLITDLATEFGWERPSDNCNSMMKRLNKKLRHEGLRVYRKDGAVRCRPLPVKSPHTSTGEPT